MNGLQIANIDDWPEGVPLERPLNAKRRRNWQPNTWVEMEDAPADPPSPVMNTQMVVKVEEAPANLLSPMNTQMGVEVEEAPADLLSPMNTQMEVKVEEEVLIPMYCEVGGDITPLASAGSIENDIIIDLNYGSEPESVDSDDEDLPQHVITTRAIVMDTPEDPVSPMPDQLDQPVQADNMTLGLGPHSMYDFQWTPFPATPIPPTARRETFVHSTGPTTPCTDPYAIFTSIWDLRFMEHIATETNRYAQQVTQQRWDNNSLKPTSRISRWQDTNADELYVYFALVLGMGIVVKSRVEEYWNVSNDLFSTPGFRDCMSFGRFTLLSKCLHFANNDNMRASVTNASEAKLFKITPVINHLNKKFQQLYNLSQNIALDESLMMWKGLLDINQFIPNKAAKIGLKTYELCESQTGYLWNFDVHTYQNVPAANQHDPLAASTPQLVLRLVAGLEGRGHTLWMDNFYNSPALARKLKTLGFDCVGTLRTNRQFVPEALAMLNKEDMRPGDLTGMTSGDVDLVVWRDQNRVAMISTYHGNGVSVSGEVRKPIAIHDYNVMMGGVDKKDQMLAMYPIERKRTWIWYKKFFRRLLNVSVLNGFIIAKRSDAPPSLTHRSFRKVLITTLIANHANRPTSAPTPSSARSLLGGHWLNQYPFSGNARQRRMCQVCRKKVSLFCEGCKKAVCMGCFPIMHQ